MRGLLTDMPGVTGAKVEAGKTDIIVSFDPAKTSVETVLSGLEEAGQTAKKKS